MGSLREDQIGAGAAVNNTTRELGGTLGVAIFGSVFASAYTPKLLAAYGSAPIPAASKDAAGHSVAAALQVAQRAPADLQATFTHAATTAFSSGLNLACLVGASVTILGAVLATWFLPGRTHEVRSVGEMLAFEA